MKSYVFIILLLMVGNKPKAQQKTDTTVYEFTSLYSSGDTSYIKSYRVNDSIFVRQEFYGRALAPASITPAPADTFVVYKDRWKKIFNGTVHSFLSEKDFDSRRQTFEHIKSESPPNLRNRYTPVKRIKTSDDKIYVYDLDGLQGKHVLYHDTRIYFSFKYGIVGYMSYNTQMLMKQFVGKVKMELRKAKNK